MVSGYAQKFKIAGPSDNLCSSEDAVASILVKFVLFEYNHVVIVIESQYRESAFYDLG